MGYKATMEAHSLPRTGRIFLPRNPRILAAFTDERLVEQIRRGNDAAFEAVYDRHHRGILSFCRHMLASADEAEDAVQQTFISAYDSLRAGHRDIRLKPWLYTIARNRCLSTLRARRDLPAELADVPTAGLAGDVQQRSDLRELLADMRELPVEQRAALVLSELGDLSHAEVGAVVGCEVAKVKSLVFQARSSLIETRTARDIPCQEIREQLATATGGALRRGPLRRHLRSCPGCAEFRDEVSRQRRALAAVLPVIPTLGLKKSALAAVGLGGGGGGVAAGGGGLGSLIASGAGAKGVAIAVATGIALGGGVVIAEHSAGPKAEAAGGQHAATPAVPAAAGPGARGATVTLDKVGAHRVGARRSHAGAANPAAESPLASSASPQDQARSGGPSVRQHGPGLGVHHHGAHPHAAPTAPPAAAHPHAAPTAPPAAGVPITTAPAPGTGGGHHGNNGHHNGWLRGRGHDHHAQDVGGVHVPSGGHGDQGSGQDGQQQTGGDGARGRIAAWAASASPPAP
jgi:RNA polymerase sigma factor (sigma-70 family)